MYALQNIKVLDLSSYIAGPYCGSLLADLGADVIKVEPPDGDAFRTLAAGFQSWNRGKKGITLDLKNSEGLRIFYRLVKEADVVLQNYKPGTAKKLKVDYSSLIKINPKLVYFTITGYGSNGPFSLMPAFDPLLQALSGCMYSEGTYEAPVFLRIPIADYGAAMIGAFGIAAAIFHRQITGEGQNLETSLLNSVATFQGAEFSSIKRKHSQKKMDLLGKSSTYRIYHCKDGWFFLSCTSDKLFKRLYKAFNSDNQLGPFLKSIERIKRNRKLSSVLAKIFEGVSLDQCITKLRENNVPCAPIRYGYEIHLDPYVNSRGASIDLKSTELGLTKQVGIAVKLSKTPGCVNVSAPSLGEHNNIVLKDLGLTEIEICKLRSEKIIT